MHLHYLRRRPTRPVLLGAGILVASISFVLLLGATRTGELRVRGTVRRSFRGAYDILVRPEGSSTTIERQRGLVRDNYLAGIFGGISFAQYHSIEHIPGVEIAAPIANLGYILPGGLIRVRVPTAAAKVGLYRVVSAYVGPAGSRYLAGVEYVYYTRRDRFAANLTEVMGADVAPLPVCDGYRQSEPPASSPFAPYDGLFCFSSRSPAASARGNELPRGFVGVRLPAFPPVMLAAIDPVQEARLLGLDRTVRSGRYLRETDHPEVRSNPGGEYLLVPAIASQRSYISDRLQVRIERLAVPTGDDVPRALATGACIGIAIPCPHIRPPAGATYRSAYDFLTRLTPAHQFRPRSYSLQPAYRQALSSPYLSGTDEYWTPSDVRYRQLAPDELEPLTTTNPLSIWGCPACGNTTYGFVPADNEDVQFRRLTLTRAQTGRCWESSVASTRAVCQASRRLGGCHWRPTIRLSWNRQTLPRGWRCTASRCYRHRTSAITSSSHRSSYSTSEASVHSLTRAGTPM